MHTKEILSNFNIKGEMVECEPFGNGHINDTYLVAFESEDGRKNYILQRMNENVFKNIDELMQNIYNVTSYVRNKLRIMGADLKRECLKVKGTNDGKLYYTHVDGTKWRVMRHINGTVSYDLPKSVEMFEHAGRKFGEFIGLLDGFPMGSLYETIPDFHNTEKRFEVFEQAVRDNVSARRESCLAEIEFAMARKHKCGKILKLMREGDIPTRVTHNDTKLNNLLIDVATDAPICVIDLDTVMPGTLLFDYGDAIRYGCNTAAEDERDLSRVQFDFEMFKAFTKGFVQGVGGSMTSKEMDYLTYGARQITFECGMRFLTDYLNGDTYFKTEYPDHNLVRCRTQFKLVAEMEAVKDKMKAYVNSLRR